MANTKLSRRARRLRKRLGRRNLNESKKVYARQGGRKQRLSKRIRRMRAHARTK